MRRALERYARDFFAIIVLAVVSIIVLGFIFVQQGVVLPNWVPVIGSERFELKAEFQTAQAVTPGQGQTVNVAGVKVGEISGVDLEDGVAVVSMNVEPKYASLIHGDASALLRPRTGLQDMTVEIDPGTERTEIADGATITLADSAPNVNLDQILASLDGDTRAYLKLLLAGGAEAFGKGRDNNRDQRLASVLRRLEPTTRDLARINGVLAKRRENLRRVITNFKLVAEELGRNDGQLTDFVSSSSSALGAFADQEQAIRGTLQGLPGALKETRRALSASDAFSNQLTPALQRLIPSADALAPALRATRPLFEQTTPSIRDQIRPFTEQAKGPVRDLRQAAGPLKSASQDLGGGLTELNLLLNALSYNPPGQEEGYLFYLAWLNHNTNSLFTVQDGQGPMRRALIQLSCQTGLLADGVTATRPFLKTSQDITRVPLSGEICPLDNSTLPGTGAGG